MFEVFIHQNFLVLCRKGAKAPLSQGVKAFRATSGAGFCPSCVPAHRNTEVSGERMPGAQLLLKAGQCPAAQQVSHALPQWAFKEGNSASSPDIWCWCFTTAWRRHVPAVLPPAQGSCWEAVPFPFPVRLHSHSVQLRFCPLFCIS